MAKCRPCEQQRAATRKNSSRIKAERSFGRARIMADKSVVYPKKGFEPPPPLEGYERDVGNAWRFIPLWPACKHRTQVIGHKPCGALSIVTRCMCAECPLFKQSITLSSCTSCESRC
jgi:hypothetical protein